MDTTLTKDARGFVDNVMSYLREESKSKTTVPKVQALLSKVTESAKKEKIAHVETSVPLTPAEKEGIERLLIHLLGHDVRVESVVKPEVLAGIRIQVGDWIVDTTFKSQLEEMAAVLIQ